VFDLKLNYAAASCMGDSIGTPDRIELIDQCTNVKFGRRCGLAVSETA
jgi:hypothetical protein